MSIATGLAVASNYYAQPLLGTMGDYLHLNHDTAGLIVTAAQVSYAIGLILFVPLGDLLEQKWLIISMLILSAFGLLITGFSNHIAWVMIGTSITGIFSVAAQILVPLSAALAKPHERGKVVGTLMAGLMLGILFARTLAGTLAYIGNWRTIYFVAFGALMLVSILLAFKLPPYKNSANIRYRSLIYSIFELFFKDRMLAVRAILGALAFANFSLLWTSITFLLSSRYGYSELIIGLFGLIGVAGAIGANQTGKLVDAGYALKLTLYGFLLITLSWIPLYFGQFWLIPLVIGVFTLDLFVPAVHITNQTKIYESMPKARGRLTAGYITAYFVGGAFGSALAAFVYEHFEWNGVVIAGILLGLFSLLFAYSQRTILK